MIKKMPGVIAGPKSSGGQRILNFSLDALGNNLREVWEID